MAGKTTLDPKVSREFETHFAYLIALIRSISGFERRYVPSRGQADQHANQPPNQKALTELTVLDIDLLHNIAFSERTGEEKDGSNASTYAQRDIDSVLITFRIGEVWLAAHGRWYGR